VTSTIGAEIADRKQQQQRRTANARLTMAAELKEQIALELTLSTRVRFPSPLYQARPVEFFRNVLGVEPWHKQIEVIEAVRDCPRVAVRSGHKVSKSHTAAGIALWFYCSFDDARVVMTSTTSRQVDQILWRELRMMRARGGRCTACKLADPEGFLITRPCEHSTPIEGEEGDLARTGLKSRDYREIVGFTAREAEAVAGISGRNLLYICDEASGIGDDIFEAIEGNRAGGARIVLFGNPTRNEGEFFEAFHGKGSHYKTITISSEETPNVVQGKRVIPGLAERDWIEEKKQEWGENSPMYRIRVKGLHALAEEGKIFSIHTITTAEQRWADTPEAGRLYIGIDPAGETGTGDETVFCVRRGLKQLLLRAALGLNEDQIYVLLLRMIKDMKLPRELPVVVIDREGSVGTKLFTLLRAKTESKEHVAPFELVGVRASDRAIRQPFLYDRLRDELAANLEQWFRDGGAIVEDSKLERELHALEWQQAVNGRLKVTPKKEIRKAIGRSPDRYDALALCAWEPLSLREAATERDETRDAYESPPANTMDPYAGIEVWR
jgi:hypothetical protein